MTKDQNFLTFELRETLYFEKGQEVLEMLGISLEPDITIQSFSDYVDIKGLIQLQGEYQRDESIKEEERLSDEEDLTPKPYFHRVLEGNHGLGEFYHQFPVDISVPLYRVPDLNRISVKVDSFDYELINQKGLRLEANINIIGISQNHEERETDFNLENQLNTDSFEFEIHVQEEEGQEEVKDQDRNDGQMIEYEQELVQVEVEDEDEEKQKDDRWKYKESQTIGEFLKKDIQTEEKTSSDKQVQVEKKASHSSEEIQDHLIVHKQNEQTIEEESLDNVSLVEAEEKIEVNFLTKWFRGDKGEEERFSQLRICIVQENDTLDQIAERYGISKLQILKQNRLDDDHLNEGQLLSIPQKGKK